MKIKINESKFAKLVLNEVMSEYNVADGNAFHNPYAKVIDKHKDSLEKFLVNNGYIMTNIENGKDYLVYEINALSTLIGSRYVVCILIKDNEPYGQALTKPLVLFKRKNY